ncbi:MAG: SGNH/GDSL hydrolase family protein [Candidatus Dojkabacteria bacterium]|nr:SGNH/GDSL hydrolase family protein [Candidatus Dojkabacteria bacterium]
MNKYLQKIASKISKNKIYKIVFYGDSITSTEWVHPNWREITKYVLEDHLTFLTKDWKKSSWNIRMFNGGLNGSTSSEMAEGIDKYVINQRPDLVLLQGNRNDLTFKVPIKKHTENINKMIKNLLSHKIETIYWGTPASLDKDRNKMFKPYLKDCLEIVKRNKIPYVNMFDKIQEYKLTRFYTFASVGNEDENMKKGQIDVVHPNQLGNAYIAKILLKDIWGIEFDPDLYIKETLEGKMYPEYYSQ